VVAGNGGPKKSEPSALVGWFEKKDVKAERVVYTADFAVDASFGEPGAVTVLNRHRREFFIESIVVEGFPSGPAHFTCNSWVQPDRAPRVFFTNRPYLPDETPPGLRELRRQELSDLRGEGAAAAAAGGERRLTDRVWEYDVYNDLGNPDKGAEFARPVLGGDRLPYPRRMRTGRPKTVTGKPPLSLSPAAFFLGRHRQPINSATATVAGLAWREAAVAVAVARSFRIRTTRSRGR